MEVVTQFIQERFKKRKELILLYCLIPLSNFHLFHDEVCCGMMSFYLSAIVLKVINPFFVLHFINQSATLIVIQSR
jgi:hypothetical protein